MILIELIYNLALLIALSVLSGFISVRWNPNRRWGAMLQGFLFGGASAIGMLRPLVIAPGLIFDGRSVMISLGGLFFGPWAAAVTCLMTIPLRLVQGGPGAMMGVLVILSSAAIGVGFQRRRSPDTRELSAAALMIFGVVVHLAMLVMTLALPPERIFSTLQRIGWPVMLTYPLATVLIGKILSDQAARADFLASLQASEERYRELVERANSIILRMDTQGAITFMNEFAQHFFGFTSKEILGRNVVGAIVPATDSAGNDLARMILDIGSHPERYKSNANENMRKDGTRTWVAWSNQPVFNGRGQCVEIMCVGNDITERKRAEDALRENQTKQSAMIANISDVIAIIDRDGINRYKSPNIEKWFGWRPEEIVGVSTWENIHREDLKRVQGIFAALLTEPGASEKAECRYRCKNGAYKWIEFTAMNLLFEPNIGGVLLNYHDIEGKKLAEAEKHKLQDQLAQAQKMESIGRLAGGVAHDFNNMLGVILGHAEITLQEIDPAHPLRASLEEIRTAAMRSVGLTRQLLAFARKQTVAPRVLDLNTAVDEMLKMLQRLIGEHIELVWAPGAGLWWVKIDPTQIDQILANIAVNARDAIAGAGKISIETSNIVCDMAYCAAHAYFLPGEYVMLTVSDSGNGMDEETRARVFEPFFTTKPQGQGTGLGLATVYGIVKQNHGFIQVNSQPGQGTTFMIYLPRHVSQAAADRTETVVAPPRSAGETVLVVEDESAILAIARRVLERLGYTVVTASTPNEAILRAKEHAGEIHLLMTDVVMPGMNGRELSQRLGSQCPKLKCLFMSGYTADVIAHHGVLGEGVCFIQKPFSMEDLAAKVRETLGDRRVKHLRAVHEPDDICA